MARLKFNNPWGTVPNNGGFFTYVTKSKAQYVESLTCKSSVMMDHLRGTTAMTIIILDPY